MELVKPEPLIIGGRAHYTLTSYDPVTIEVDVRQVTEEDVDYAMQLTVMQAGGGPEQLADDAWIAEQFMGVKDASELRMAVRDQLQAVNMQLAEDQKASACANALVERLVQRVPREQVTRAREMVARGLMQNLAQDGISEETFLATSGMRKSDLELMLDQQAQVTAEHAAAISAWAEERKLQVTDDEIPRLVGIPPAQTEEFRKQMATMGMSELEELRRAALQSKAMEIIVAECSCTYHHESPAEAAARVARMQAEQETFMREMQSAQNNDKGNDKSDGPKLKLV